MKWMPKTSNKYWCFVDLIWLRLFCFHLKYHQMDYVHCSHEKQRRWKILNEKEERKLCSFSYDKKKTYENKAIHSRLRTHTAICLAFYTIWIPYTFVLCSNTLNVKRQNIESIQKKRGINTNTYESFTRVSHQNNYSVYAEWHHSSICFCFNCQMNRTKNDSSLWIQTNHFHFFCKKLIRKL